MEHNLSTTTMEPNNNSTLLQRPKPPNTKFPSNNASTSTSPPKPQLPPYKPPQTPLFKALPSSFIPYAELMRLHKPAGYYAIFFPHITGTLLAAASFSRGTSTPPPTPQTLTTILLLHIIASLFVRGAACTYNDAIDFPLDRLVLRCKTRPVARGAVSPFSAHIFALGQTFVWIGILLAGLPRETLKPAVWLGGTQLVYPWCKRFTNYPQIVLGFSLALGLAIGAGAVGWDVSIVLAVSVTGKAAWEQVGFWTFYLSSVLNAVIYDTVYAYQDISDDLAAGVMSMAIACLGRTKQLLGVLSIVEVGLLAVTGWAMGFREMYWVFCVGGTAGVLGWMLVSWRIEDREDCWGWFCWLIWCTGGTVCCGLVGEYVVGVLGGGV